MDYTRTHNLVRLAQLAGITNELDQKQIDLLASLSPFCIEARYADYHAKMAKLTKRKNVDPRSFLGEILKTGKIVYKK